MQTRHAWRGGPLELGGMEGSDKQRESQAQCAHGSCIRAVPRQVPALHSSR
jgi:hypothetical protein